MTNELNKRITTAENYSTDLLHEIRNPLHLLKVLQKLFLKLMIKKKEIN